jgi:curved DNA-binding protein CbpA
MKIEFLLNKKNPYYVLGVPTFATPGQIRSAYVKRVKMLRPYHFDKAKHPIQWQIANDLLQELNEAYDQVRSSDQNKRNRSGATAVSQDRPGPAEVDNFPGGQRSESKEFSFRENAESAIENFRKLAPRLTGEQARDAFTGLIATRGFSKSQILPANSPHTKAA